MRTFETAHEPQAHDPGERAEVGPSGTDDNVAADGGRLWPTGWSAVLWLPTVTAVARALILPLNGRPASGTVLLLLVPISLIHGVRRYGAKVLIIFLVETLEVSNFFENLSITPASPSATITTPADRD
jgi:hypothetical protein